MTLLYKKISLIILTAALLLFSSENSSAKIPWEWQFTLKAEHKNQMNMPASIYIDADKERYYVVDTGNNRLISFDREGKLLSAFNANKSLLIPADMERNIDGTLWVIEKGRNTLTQIDLKNKEVIPHDISSDGKTLYPSRLELDGGKLYILDRMTGDIIRLSADLKPEVRYGCNGCMGGFIDFKVKEGVVTGLVQIEKTLYRFDNDGKQTSKVVLGNDIGFAYSFAIGPTGLLYVVDRYTGTIDVYDESGQFKYEFLGKGQVRGRLYYPAELKFDPWGRLCIVDEGNGRVEVYSR